MRPLVAMQPSRDPSQDNPDDRLNELSEAVPPAGGMDAAAEDRVDILSGSQPSDDDDACAFLYRPSRLFAAAVVIVLIAAVTALLEAAFLSIVMVGVVGIGVLIVTGLGQAFVREPIGLRDDLLMVATAAGFPTLTVAILKGLCGIGLPFHAPGCAPALAQLVVLLNFLFSFVGILGAWLAYRVATYRRNMPNPLNSLFRRRQDGASGVETRAQRAARERLDRQVLTSMREAGADLRKPHALEHHFLVYDRDLVDAVLADELAVGYTQSEVVEGEDQGLPYWYFDLIKAIVPEEQAVFAETLRMNTLAAKYGVTYDGWGCNIER